jgi:hypothetical protein
MKLLNRAGAAACLFLLCAGTRLDAQSVRGRVLDAETGREMSAAVRIQLVNAAGAVAGETVSGERGVFRLLVQSPGTYTLRASALGYRDTATPITLRSGEELVMDVKVAATAIPLDPVTVTARRTDPRHEGTREGMLARHALFRPVGSRRVVLASEDELVASMTVNEVLQWFPGTMRERCTIVYWDGRVVDNRELSDEWLSEPLVPHLEAVEFYARQSEAPPVFRHRPAWAVESAQDCRVVALWPGAGYLPPARWVQPYRARFTAGGGPRHSAGRQAPEIGPAAEALLDWQIRRHFALGVFASHSRAVLASQTLDELTAGLGHGSAELGTRRVSMSAAGVQGAIELRPGAALRPLLAARVMTARRSFNPFVEPGARPQVAGGRGAGVSLGAERSLGQALVLRAVLSHDRISFDPYGGLERWGASTAGTWSMTTLRLELGHILVR